MLKAKEIHNRITAIQATQQITKALKIIATTKLRKVKKKTVALLPYLTEFTQLFDHITFATQRSSLSPFLALKKKEHILLTFFTTNRGFCGGFNKQVCHQIKHLYQHYLAQNKTIDIIPIGKKGTRFLQKQQIPYISKDLNLENNPCLLQQIRALSKFFIDSFKNNLYDHILLVYQTNTKGLEQGITIQQLFPLQPTTPPIHTPASDYIYEPSQKVIIHTMLPDLIALKFYQACLKALEAEHTARNKAMTQATDNADTLLQELRIAYNQTRQRTITRQIIEIITSAEALNKA